MKITLAVHFLFLFLCSNSLNAQQTDHPEIEIWPTGLPSDATQLDEKRIADLKAKQHPRGHVLYVDKPTLTVYQAPVDKRNGCAVVVCPGGGYHVLAWQHEGIELAEWFNSIGVTAFILKYRVPRRHPRKNSLGTHAGCSARHTSCQA